MGAPAGLDYDVLVLAGDVDKGARGMERFDDWPQPVVYVLGNREDTVLIPSLPPPQA